MADNTTLPGTGDVIASDDIGGVKFQRVKTTFGPDGTATDVSATTPLPVAQNDCTILLSTTVSSTGAGTSIDSLGYSSISIQLSGLWSGDGFFETSNNNSDWYLIPVFSRDSIVLQDQISTEGLYVIRPTGRYVRFNCTNLTGNITFVALGRFSEGASPSDALSLALDARANTPMRIAPGVAGPTPQAQAFPVTFSNEERLDKCYTVPFLGSISGMNALTGTQDWLDVSQYSAVYLSLIGISASGSFVIETTNAIGSGITFPLVYRWDLFGISPINASLSPAASTNTNNAGVFVIYPNARYLRYRIAGVSNNNGLAMVRLCRIAPPTAVTGVNATITGTATTTPATPTQSFVNSAATTNATSVKGSAGTVHSITTSNTGAAAAYVKFYNKATAPTVGTDVPVFTITVPASGSVNLHGGALGMRFGTGIALAITNLAADTDTTAVAAAQVKVATSYI